MSHCLKILGLALVAVLAMSAVMVSGAMANKEFHSLGAPTYLTGQQHSFDGVIKTDGGEITCNNAVYSGSVSTKTASSITLTPAYSECHLIFLFTFNATIDVNGCAYLFHIKGGANPENELETTIECPAGKVIEVTVSGCTVTIPAQSPLFGLSFAKFTNSGTETEMDLTLDLNLVNIHYTEHGGSCATSTQETTNGTYSDNATIRGYNSESIHNETTWVPVTVF